jgi:hypothetical protein
MAEMKGHDQVERHLSHRLDQQPAAESIALVKRQNRVDEGRAVSRETHGLARICSERLNRAGDGLGK